MRSINSYMFRHRSAILRQSSKKKKDHKSNAPI